MAQREIELIFEPGKPAVITSKGFAGAECKSATKVFEEALGKVVSDLPTREMNLVEHQHVRATH